MACWLEGFLEYHRSQESHAIMKWEPQESERPPLGRLAKGTIVLHSREKNGLLWLNRDFQKIFTLFPNTLGNGGYSHRKRLLADCDRLGVKIKSFKKSVWKQSMFHCFLFNKKAVEFFFFTYTRCLKPKLQITAQPGRAANPHRSQLIIRQSMIWQHGPSLPEWEIWMLGFDWI